MSMIVILVIIWTHFFADFILQTDKIAKNKGNDNRILTLHVLIYSAPFFWFGATFVAITAVTHFITDYFTSRWTTKLYNAGKRHWFFVVIGFDQAIHMTTLILTYEWVYK